MAVVSVGQQKGRCKTKAASHPHNAAPRAEAYVCECWSCHSWASLPCCSVSQQLEFLALCEKQGLTAIPHLQGDKYYEQLLQSRLKAQSDALDFQGDACDFELRAKPQPSRKQPKASTTGPVEKNPSAHCSRVARPGARCCKPEGQTPSLASDRTRPLQLASSSAASSSRDPAPGLGGLVSFPMPVPAPDSLDLVPAVPESAAPARRVRGKTGPDPGFGQGGHRFATFRRHESFRWGCVSFKYKKGSESVWPAYQAGTRSSWKIAWDCFFCKILVGSENIGKNRQKGCVRRNLGHLSLWDSAGVGLGRIWREPVLAWGVWGGFQLHGKLTEAHGGSLSCRAPHGSSRKFRATARKPDATPARKLTEAHGSSRKCRWPQGTLPGPADKPSSRTHRSPQNSQN